jgi:hypothetical protein
MRARCRSSAHLAFELKRKPVELFVRVVMFRIETLSGMTPHSAALHGRGDKFLGFVF